MSQSHTGHRQKVFSSTEEAFIDFGTAKKCMGDVRFRFQMGEKALETDKT